MATWNEKQIQNLKFTAIRDLLGESGQFSINSNGEVEFLENSPTCTEQEILKRMDEILEEYDATSYINYRKAEYDKLNQFELMYNDKINGTNTWTTEIYKIKDKFPKKK
jgi:hypothetical protein